MRNILIATVLAGTLISCGNNKEAELRARQATIDSLNQVMARQRVIDSMAQVAAAQRTQDSLNQVMAAQQEELARAKAATHRRRSTGYSHSSSNTYTGNMPADNATTTTTKKKKGWSATAKGALIGVGAGALTGAMVDKKKGEGAVVGGIIGAAAGAGTGLIIDKKKKKQQQQK